MADTKETLTYEIESAPQASRKKECAMAVVWTERYGRWFFEPHASYPTKRDAELAAVARAEKYAKGRGYIAR